jgi:hypothetical protein
MRRYLPNVVTVDGIVKDVIAVKPNATIPIEVTPGDMVNDVSALHP